MKISRKWWRMAELYRRFAEEQGGEYDFSRTAAEAMYAGESGLGPNIPHTPDESGQWNGYAAGKHWMGVTVSMWLEDLRNGLLTKRDLYDDPTLPDWWLDRVLPQDAPRGILTHGGNIERETAISYSAVEGRPVLH